MYSQPTSISWKFFLFLHNLTPVQSFGGNKTIYAHLRLIFEGPFRSYKDFIYDLTMDPSMLEYLNLRLSRKETPDENYAREVQELFTVGKRPFSRYTEGDVQAAARLLVGWDFDWEKSIYGDGSRLHGLIQIITTHRTKNFQNSIGILLLKAAKDQKVLRNL